MHRNGRNGLNWQCETHSEFNDHYSVYNLNRHVNGKLQEEDKVSWVEALRSGNYPQTMGTLHDKAGYCCLGVKCEIDPRVVDLGMGANSFHKYSFGSGAFNISSGTLPLPYAGELGIDPKGTFYFAFTVFDKTYVKKYSLVDLNDSRFTFDQIADVIEYFF